MATPDIEVQEAFRELVAARVNDQQRLVAVAATGLLDTGADEPFDRIAAIAARVLKAPHAFITIVDDRRSFWKACIGVDSDDPSERQNGVEESFCQYVIGIDQPLMINDTRLDSRTRDNPSIESMGVLAWAGAPLRSDSGEVLGTVCVVDTDVRTWTLEDAAVLSDLAAIAADELRARSVARSALRTQAILSSVLDRAPVGFAVVDARMRYEMINEALANINGAPVADHIGSTVGQMVPAVASEVEAYHRSVFEGGEAILDVEITGETQASPGEERVWTASYFPVDVGGGGLRVATMVSDVTERVHSRTRAERLAEVARQLGLVQSLDEVATVITTLVPKYLGAQHAWGGVLHDRTGNVRLLVPETDREVVRAITDDDAEDVPYREAARTGLPVYVTSTTERDARYPAGAEIARALGIEASASIPLHSSAGEVFGVLVVGWAKPMRRSEFPVPQLATLGDLLAQTVERVTAAEDRSELVAAMRESTMGRVPDIAGLDIAIRYEAAASTLGFGGDWYDVVRIDDDRTAFIVGDVVGHDPAAAARMTRVRTVVSALLRLGTPLEGLFDQTDDVLGAEDPVQATVSVSVIDRRFGTITTVSAGHPPPILVRPDGSACWLEQGRRPWLGIAAPPPRPEAIDIEPGAMLVAYSDGLVEQRQGDLSRDLDLLRDEVAVCRSADVETVADRLLDLRQERSDDAALIVVRLDSPAVT